MRWRGSDESPAGQHNRKDPIKDPSGFCFSKRRKENECCELMLKSLMSIGYSFTPEFDWKPETIGIIDSSFFWGYLVTQIPGGFLAARYPANRLSFSKTAVDHPQASVALVRCCLELCLLVVGPNAAHLSHLPFRL
ncbi:hypothetical protein AVEN_84518-1 [Araneus ventricosus]|uniref:Uncharacterized protein n=1 Tax=Araneus ventricosus TaxID=182803 RepID=A0A4Y2FAZ1_ARAVE|nr:hypothetical protein AVEN_84518-1 [Araneus ventricosus]